MIAFLELDEEGMEVVDGGKVGFDSVAVGVGTVVGGHIAGHDFFAKDIAVAFNLAALTRAAVAGVEDSGIGGIVANGPHHALKDERRRSLLALHEGEDEVLIVGIEGIDMPCEEECLVEGIGKKADAVGTCVGDFLFHLGDALLLEWQG